jgi:hypothetical protein
VKLELVPGEFSIWRLDADAPAPSIDSGSFLSVTRTEDELSIVSLTVDVPDGAKAEPGWRCLKLEGPLPFDMTGVLATLSTALAEAGVPIFVVSTYNTDYLLVKANDIEKARSTLLGKGHVIV